MSASANSLIKILPISNTYIRSLPTNPVQPCVSIPYILTKPNHSLSLSSSHRPLFFLQKKTFSSSSIVSCVAQQGDTDTNSMLQGVEESGQQELSWDNQEFETAEAKVSDWEVRGGDEATEEGGKDGFTVSEGGDEGGFVEPPEEAKIYVGNLPYDIDSEKLAEIFDPAGIVEISEVIYNRETDRSRGFGFVTMSTVEEAEKAAEMFNGYELGGRTLTVNKAAPRGSRPERVERPPRAFEPSFRIYVGNLPWDTDSSRLQQVFSDFGQVIDARIVFDRETGRSRGFGFVTMSSEAEVNEAISALDGQTLDGRIVRVNVAEERPRRNF